MSSWVQDLKENLRRLVMIAKARTFVLTGFLSLVTMFVCERALSQEAKTPRETDQGVRQFGAVGDGQADDNDAIQKAVDSGSGIIRLTKGIYRITRPITIDLDKVGYTSICGDGVGRIVMAGPGPALKFVGTHFKSADPAGFSKDVWERQRMPMVGGMGIDGDHSEARGIGAHATM